MLFFSFPCAVGDLSIPSYFLLLCSDLSHPVSQSPPPSLVPVLVPTVPDDRHEVPGALCHCFDGGEIFSRQLQVRAAASQAVTDVLPRPCDA